ncbi:DJ-1/PfpI family protein [Antrihabitans sp. YC3-6]|uniref:DJ-1/PfpI family protein n=1 Tax=Antrihabitans stalagmiti TaxID=2799499 RepID=A0A934NQ66_9NOCA|nr:DJ-1/PfpI family protein [Antrihabitans stalagmiti]MBJ8339396.1 DJ-1/PfpI family protein [Antrihabitans stalagmiti]
MQIAIVLYPGMTALDVVGPYEVLRAMKGAEIRFVWHEVGPIVTDSGVLVLGATHSFADTLTPDIVLVGGSATDTMTAAADARLLDWLRGVHRTTTWTLSVCSGSAILAAAGILDGRPATSHWAALPILRTFGAKPVGSQRIVQDGKIVTAAGVSAGIDLALWLVGEIEGQARAEAIQLLIEYDPQPPFDSGHLSKASPKTKALAAKVAAGMVTPSDVGGEAVATAKVAWDGALRKIGRLRS